MISEKVIFKYLAGLKNKLNRQKNALLLEIKQKDRELEIISELIDMRFVECEACKGIGERTEWLDQDETRRIKCPKCGGRGFFLRGDDEY